MNFLVPETEEPNSRVFFKPHWMIWRILGVRRLETLKGRYLYMLYSILLNLMVTIWFPLHLALQLFRNDTMADNIKNLGICIVCVACCSKLIIFATKLSSIQEFEAILQRLDERITNKVEVDYFKRLRKRLRFIAIMYFCFYLPVGVTAQLSVVMRKERTLLYPAWFPFNWRESTSLFVLANVYQVISVFILLTQNYVDDTFPSMALCVLSGHIKILSMRVSNIGHDNKSLEENEQELNLCVKDQQLLYELYKITENIISWPIFMQLSVAAINICLGIAALIFFVSDPLDILYYIAYLPAIQLEIFPACYYGSEFQILADELHRPIYDSNWIEQTPKFKKHMILFTERTLRQHFFMAGGMVRLNLDTFLATCRGAYSMTALITSLK